MPPTRHPTGQARVAQSQYRARPAANWTHEGSHETHSSTTTGHVRVAAAELLPITIAPKRKPGRPQGSKNKEVGKPRKPREKKVVFEEPVESVPRVAAELLYEELPRATPGSLPIPTEAYDLRTAKMLRLLQMQTDHRKQQKANLYSSWFR